jgi:hypothetical protein
MLAAVVSAPANTAMRAGDGIAATTMATPDTIAISESTALPASAFCVPITSCMTLLPNDKTSKPCIYAVIVASEASVNAARIGFGIDGARGRH